MPPPLRLSWLLREAPAGEARRAVFGLSPLEGMGSEIATSLTGGSILTAWALHLGGGPAFVGIVAAIPFLAQLIQIPAAVLTASIGSRRVAVVSLACSRLSLLWLVLLPSLPVAPETKRVCLLAIVATVCALSVVGTNAWAAWMADLVPRRFRGRFMGNRAAACALGATAASLIAGPLLDRAREHGSVGSMLASLACVAAGAAVVSTMLLVRQSDARESAAPIPTVADAMGVLEREPSRRWTAYLAVWGLATGIGGSFYVVHMLRDLGMTFAAVAAHGAGITAVRVLVAPHWGRAVDRFGARPVLLATSAGLALMPLLWLGVTPERTWPLVFDSALAGLLWAGHGVAFFALPLALVPPRARRMSLAAFATASGISFAIASSLAGSLAEALPARVSLPGITVDALVVLFLLSGLLQLCALTLIARIRADASVTRSR